MGCGYIKKSYKVKHNIKKSSYKISCLYELSNGGTLTCGGDGVFYFRNPEDIYEIDMTVKAHSSQIISLLELTSRYICTVGKDNNINVWDFKDEYKKVANYKFNYEAFKSIKIEKWVIAVCGSEGISTYEINIDKGIKNIRFAQFSSPCEDMILLKDGRLAGTCLYRVGFWKFYKKKQKVEYMNAHLKKLRSIYQLRDGRLLTGAEDKMIYIWNVNEQRRINELEGHKGPIISMYQLSRGNLITGDQYCLIYVWNLDLTEIEVTLIEEGSIIKIGELKDGSLITFSNAHECKIWEEVEYVEDE